MPALTDAVAGQPGQRTRMDMVGPVRAAGPSSRARGGQCSRETAAHERRTRRFRRQPGSAYGYVSEPKTFRTVGSSWARFGPKKAITTTSLSSPVARKTPAAGSAGRTNTAPARPPGPAVLRVGFES